MFAETIYTLKRPFHFLKTGIFQALPAQIRYKFPAKKLKIICITGTDGKTTSSTLLYETLKAAGKKVALLSTVAAYIGNEEIDTGFHVTTPDPRQLQKFMRRMVDEGYEYLVLEATSHGIYQYRLWGITPLIVGITNITMEHLDYHITHHLYVKAKAMIAKKAQIVVLNADDEMSFSQLKKELSKSKVRIETYSLTDKLPQLVGRAIKKRFVQHYNLMNSRLVYTIAKRLDIEDSAFITAIRDFKGVPGRMQTVSTEGGIEIIVDFAHTPNALDEALTYLRGQERKGKLIAVYGSAGLRDWKKRPAMGRVGAELADLVVFTAEDPRTENIWAIIRQMKQDLSTFHHKVLSIADRREAIFFAVTHLARPGDTVAIFGKGHEKSICYGKIEYPWSDKDVALAAVEARKKI